MASDGGGWPWKEPNGPGWHQLALDDTSWPWIAHIFIGLHMTSDGLGELFEGGVADMYSNKFQLVLMWEQEPPSARAEICIQILFPITLKPK
jgi:hypothetical protein